MLRRAFLGLLLLAAGLAAVLGFNTWRQRPVAEAVAALPPLAVDGEAAAQSLAAALRARTVSQALEGQTDDAAFDALAAHLRARYPLVHQRLAVETVGRHTRVYTWKGSDASVLPFALMAHQDVVPIAPGTEPQWQQPPWDGVEKAGEVWGRGAWDDKGNLIAQMEAAEALLKAGFEPRRTLYLIQGDDEEVGGERGAARVAALFKQRGIHLDFVLDEGLLVVDGVIRGLTRPAALIGVAEKGSVSIQLVAQGAPGHSSMPPAAGQSAIGRLAAALARLDAHPMPAALQGVAQPMFAALAPDMGWAQRVVLTNLWLFGPLVQAQLEKAPATNAMLRTTTALTVVHAGVKENVLPGRADATVNFRLLPGDTPQAVLEHVRRVVDDPAVELRIAPGAAAASPVSATDSASYRLLNRTVREAFPDAVVAPGLMVAATDARHFTGLADAMYRFSPLRSGPQDLARLHGTNERLSVSNLVEMIRFYHRLVQQAASPTATGPTP